MNLNLDNNFSPFTKGENIKFESFTFSGGEPHIKILSNLSNVKEVNISHKIQSFQDFGLLLLAIDALKRMGIEKINVFIPYFPAARQDRVMVRGESLSVKVYTDILNSQHLNKVIIYDVHSEVAPALLNQCVNIDNTDFIQSALKGLGENTLLVSPDGGALKKIYKLAEKLENYEVLECSKQRNVKTRKLSGFKVYAEDLKGRDCIIIDDICDGGRTFIGLAEELKKKNAGKLYLAVSHGIFSKGLEKLGEHFDKIFTTNAFKDYKTNEKLSVFSLEV
ncbi:MAG: ribose-phosphate diphosphokinase [Chitinophagales bacterium]